MTKSVFQHSTAIRSRVRLWCCHFIALTLALGLSIQTPLAYCQHDVLVVGVVVPLGGSHISDGQEMLQGIKLAMKSWSGSSKLQLQVKDNDCNPTVSAFVAQQLVDAKVDIVIGSPCATVGSFPSIFATNGVPFILTGPTRVKLGTDNAVQFGRVDLNEARNFASQITKATSWQVEVYGLCWSTYNIKATPDDGAALCPTVTVDEKRWKDVERQFFATSGGPVEMTMLTAFGYAAMEVAMAALKNARLNGDRQEILKHKSFDTLLGTVGSGDSKVSSRSTLILVMPQRSTDYLQPDQQRAIEMLKKDKDCGCKKGSDCPQGMQWVGAQVSTQCCTKGSDCPQGHSITR